MKKYAEGVIWDRRSGIVGDWYPTIPDLINPIWRTARRQLVSLYWLPGLRAFYSSSSPKAGSRMSEVFFAQSAKVQIKIGIEVHVSSKQPFKMLGWVNIRLTDDDKTVILEDKTPVDQMLDDLGSLVFRGYRFSMAWDDYSDAVQSSLVCANPEDSNFGCGLSARHPNPDMSLRALMYKFSLALPQPWTEQLSSPKGNAFS